MPFASGNRLFIPAAIIAGIALLWKGGLRGRLCVLMLVLIVWPGDSFICNTVKHAVARPRPFVALPGVRLFGKILEPPATNSLDSSTPAAPATGSRGDMDSMPSSHAANWFAATMVLLVYYRRSWLVMLPLALLVCYSRIYNGMHYPSDVLAGAILGSGYAAAGMCAFQMLWQTAGKKWFPLWWRNCPNLLNVPASMPDHDPEPRLPSTSNLQPSLDLHWLRLGYVLIGVLLVANLAYLASGLIELSEDEAYQWVWSKHLALSYYSKPPLIAYTQFLGTHLWGDNEFGVRFFSPVISAVLGFLLLRFFAREVNARAGFFLLIIIAATPLMALGSILMTIDPLSVLFWTAAMLSGWRAVQPGAKTGPWLWTGLWMGLGFLSKYTALFQWLCWITFFALWRPAREHLRRPGPYLALLINLACAVPVVVWNAQHHWITVSHVAYDASIGAAWHPTLSHLFDFLGKECVLLNPVFFIAAAWAAVAFWRRRARDPRMVYLFSMGAPLFLVYLLYTLHSGVLPNWIAPSVLPLFCLMAIFWDTRWRLGLSLGKFWLITGLAIGLPVVVLLHDTNLVQKIVGVPLPPKPDPLTRVRGYRRMAEIVDAARSRLLEEGKPVFVIGAHYGTTSLLNFYIPEARTNVQNRPLVYFLTSDRPWNQYYFWPSYEDQRKGENAIYVWELAEPPLVRGWPAKWLAGETQLRLYEPRGASAPPGLMRQFDSVTDLGLYKARYHGRIFHTIQMFECRNLH